MYIFKIVWQTEINTSLKGQLAEIYDNGAKRPGTQNYCLLNMLLAVIKGGGEVVSICGGFSTAQTLCFFFPHSDFDGNLYIIGIIDHL